MEKSSLLLDVRDAATTNLLHNKQKKLLENLGFRSASVDSIEEGKAVLASHLRSFRTFIVLDDVDHVDQLNALLPSKKSLGSESLIGSDDEEEEAFLDTACFFTGEKSHLAIEIWNCSGWSGMHTWEREGNFKSPITAPHLFRQQSLKVSNEEQRGIGIRAIVTTLARPMYHYK
ncbi:hypothetical protein SUGI_0861470 [Cryptomeria japonica]|nr:hypothetical protein SUGI_0861470 [Cryptomeria japonica]